MQKRLLLLSNSTNPGEPFLGYPGNEIQAFLGKPGKILAFVPYAIVTKSYDFYTGVVTDRFAELGHVIRSLHREDNIGKILEECDGIVVGGGNTFHLLTEVYHRGLAAPVRQLVNSGKPYIGWSAGSNLACPTIMTTNDMPIIRPPDFTALDFVPFQINPHYLDSKPEGHGGESREDRINEFVQINRDIAVIGLREGTLLKVHGEQVELIGTKSMRRFQFGQEPEELGPGYYAMNVLK